ncbi:hypothetical protein EJ05DRAFT_513380 [Pseudovirgaria hyperparasitica]|uniref:Uncharacterized protein n=1 Tax=Pseudovirgaria hyperparasitica TaxID=470096 RepID=A0A6A6VWU4_9PEZI|nr:uncharacterized protein EJ05DRAFT_513380 [Pseudovirgaria hyperparasitica]KAF2755062.1 hypothetical protein EJ05DRAFT_513380 [Pseudovirgaria hyperparasitica]
MRLPILERTTVSLAKRADDKGRTTLIIVAALVIGLLVLSITFHYFTRAARARANGTAGNPTSVGRGGIWSRWPWQQKSNRGAYSSSLQGDELTPSAHRSQASINATRDADTEMAASAANPNVPAEGGVDRNTSVRSVMTLPAYSLAARENERILGREGERAGIDVVIEYPEADEEEEARREEEMNSLYQIRVARRAEAAEREERRRLRREARARGDMQAVAEIRRRAESAASESLSAQLIAEHQLVNRERRVSSVDYRNVGLATHDGTRIRANSSESDRRPLLDSAASMAESHRTLSTDMGHTRGRSGSSVLSLSTNASDEDMTTQRTISRTSGNTDFEIISLRHSDTPSASHSAYDMTPGSDMGVQSIPQIDPPVYDDLAIEDAPPYESPVSSRPPPFPNISQRHISGRNAPQLPDIERLPSIRVTNVSQDARANASSQ